MKELEVTKRQVSETQKEVINGQEVFYQFSYLEGKKIENIHFFTKSEEKDISGSYRVSSGELELQTQNIKCCDDLAIVNQIFSTIRENFISETEE